MICRSCGHENRGAARFCEQCASPLARACTKCGTELRAEARFCDSCGQPAEATPRPGGPDSPRRPRDYTPKHLADKILQSKSALEGERKQVTVLFADVKGSMELAEQLDPEEWHTILDRFFAILTDGVHRFEGTVNQYTGDGIMALFGAPIAHEDHAQRACYAALHLRDEIARYATEVKREHGVGFSTRMGLNSGEVVVGAIGDDLRMDYTAQGHTVGLAQRMESLAEPNSCYLTASAAGLAGGYFKLDDLGEFRVKGVAEPVRVHRLAGVGDAQSRFDRSRAKGLSRFVGRAADLRTLEDAVEQTDAGNGQVVGIMAEAGTGKSRLCFEFLERCRARGMKVFEGRAVAHGRNIPFLPILEVYRSYFGITFQDDDRTAREKIAGRMVVLDQRLAESLPLLYDFLGVSDPQHPLPRLDPEVRQRQLIGIMREVIRTLNDVRPTVTMIEDLHWLDDASAEFIEHMVDARAGTRNLLLLNFRPEFRADWMQKSWYRQIPLTPLGRDAIAELLADLLGKDPSLAGLATPIHERTRGNPFFTEEVAQTLIESGHLKGDRGAYKLVTPIERLEVPATVQAVLAARIDRLPEREKRLLQVASVIGKDFPEPLLAAVAELAADELKAALTALRRAEFIHEQAIYPVVEYSFKHPLTQEVALGSLLKERRRRVHAAVARAIERQDAAHLDERAALLAHHYEEAGEKAFAARWHGRAARWVGQSDLREGLRHWRRARELAPEVENSEERNDLALQACNEILSLGWRTGGSDEEAAAVFAQGRALVENAGDVPALALLLGRYSLMRYSVGGSAHDYARYAEEGAQLAQTCDDPALRAAVGQFAAYGHWSSGDGQRVLEWSARVLEETGSDGLLGKALVGFSPRAAALTVRVQGCTYLGRLEEATSQSKEAERVCEELGELEVLTWLHCFQAALAHTLGVPEFSLETGLRSLAIAEQLDNEASRGCAYLSVGVAHLMRGELAAAREAFRASAACSREHWTQDASLPRVLALLAEAELALGDRAEALAAVREGIEVGQAGGARYFEAEVQIALARVLMATDGEIPRTEIEAALDRAEFLIATIAGRGLSSRVLEQRGRLAAALGNAEESRRLLYQALDLYREIAAAGHAKRLAKELES